MGENVSACGRTPLWRPLSTVKPKSARTMKIAKCTAECVCVGCCCGDVTTKSGTECRTFRNN